jgi:predicted nucleic-acid-binding Zn-ribbon protein
VNSNYDSVKNKKCNYNEFYQNLVKVKVNKRYYKGRINPKDMEFLVNETFNI